MHETGPELHYIALHALQEWDAQQASLRLA